MRYSIFDLPAIYSFEKDSFGVYTLYVCNSYYGSYTGKDGMQQAAHKHYGQNGRDYNNALEG